MSSPINIQVIQNAILKIRGRDVILDRDVARIYGVLTKNVNRAVKNNIEKFPDNYILKLREKEKNELVQNFHQFNSLKHSKVQPTAFTEKGLYMLATILKSPQATAATLSIIETFAKLRCLTGQIQALSAESNPEKQKHLMHKSGQLMADILDDAIVSNDSETSIELNFAVLKFKHTVSRKK